LADPGVNAVPQAVADEGDLNQLLTKRAQLLASIDEDDSETEESFAVLEFQVGRERCAIATTYAAEVSVMRPITPVPGVPHFFAGAVNHRGAVVAVMDLAKMLDLETTEKTASKELIFLKQCGSNSCLLVGEIHYVRSVSQNELLPFPVANTTADNSFFSAVLSDGVSILDPKRLLQDPRFVIDSHKL
jgi:purine-binding chemotaxis protein CheW